VSLHFWQHINICCLLNNIIATRGRIFSRVRPFYEQAVSDLDRSMHRSLWVLVTQSSFMEGSHTNKNTASEVSYNSQHLNYISMKVPKSHEMPLETGISYDPAVFMKLTIMLIRHLLQHNMAIFLHRYLNMHFYHI